MTVEAYDIEPVGRFNFEVIDLGLRPYREVWKLQQELQQDLIAGRGQNTLLLCEHHEVITVGRQGDPTHITANQTTLRQRNIEIVEIERGGDVTWHGPGQLVCYPIINLSDLRRDVDWYMRSLEQVVIGTLSEFDLEAKRVPGFTGVWCESDKARKIASIGVRISRWCTLHGFALNVCNDLDGFSLMLPCGLQDVEMTTLVSELQRKNPLKLSSFKVHMVQECKKIIEEKFRVVFNSN